MCGFSRFVSEILKFYKINDFSYMNVLAQEDLRSIIKKATDWPTFPQLYVRGELIGGSDIVMELHKDGKLEDILLGKKEN